MAKAKLSVDRFSVEDLVLPVSRSYDPSKFDLDAYDDFINEVVAAVSFPVIAIGGIRPEHVRSLVHRGAHGVAAIRGIWNDENSELAASRYLSQV